MMDQPTLSPGRGTGIKSAIRGNLCFLVITVLYLILALAYSVIVPLGEAPDEVPHFTYILYISRHGRLPVGAEEHEGFQPPLYYIIGAAATFWIDTDDYVIKANGDYSFTDDVPPFNLLLHTTAESFPYHDWALAWHLIRLLSVAMGATTVWATYRIAWEIFPDDKYIALGASAFNAFLPQFLFIGGVINNDNLAAALSSLMLLVMVRILKGARRYRNFLLLGTLTGLGVLAKASLLNFFAIIFIVIGVVLWQERGEMRALLRRSVILLALVVIPFLVVSGWWFVRNQILYGDPLGWQLVLAANALREAPLSLADIQWLIWGLYRSFWYRWIGIELELPFYAALAVPCVLALVGLIILIFRRKKLKPPAPLILALLGLYFLIVSGSLIPWTATVQGTDQARLLYPALPAIALFMFLGWAQFVPRKWGNYLALGVGGAMLLFAIIAPLRYTMPTYAPPLILTREDLADVQYPVDINFGDKIKLVGYDLNGETWRPGDTLLMNLYWEALEDLDQDYWLLMRLVHRRGWDLVFKDGCPSGGRYTTDFWKAGDIIRSLHRLKIPDDAPGHRYRLTLSMHPFDSVDWLPVLNEQGEVTGDIVILTLIPVGS
jgi:4-amino-4-deoxy-L-arabinose transferase-like glycosyltransferase